jgi:hypothetical protein
MGHLEYLLDLRKAKPHITDYVEPLPDLPGIHREERLAASNRTQLKKEYNRSLNERRDTSKKHKAAQGAAKKELRVQKDRINARMEGLLTDIGIYTPGEKQNGFKEDGNEF